MAKDKGIDHVSVANRIVRFYADNQGCGHSKAVIEGAARTKANIVVATEAELDRAFKGCKGDKLISLAEIEAGELDKELVKGFPLVLDNGAMTVLIQGLLGEIDAAKEAKGKKAAKKAGQ